MTIMSIRSKSTGGEEVMSIFNKIGGGFPPNVPTAQNVRNHQNQNTDTMNGIIRSAVWPQRAGLGQSVPFSIKLNRLPIAKSAIVEILFNIPNLPPQVVGVPIILQANRQHLEGQWHAAAPRSGNTTQGFFTFRVRVDNQSKTSNGLTVSNQPVPQVVQKLHKDGWDG